MQNEPMGQGAQAEREVALKAEEKVPAGQGSAAEVVGQYMPSGQETQALDGVWGSQY